MADTLTLTSGALSTLANTTRTSDVKLAGILGCSRQAAHGKRKGTIPLSLKDIDRLVAYYEIPPTALFMEVSELLTWMGSSGWSAQRNRQTPWIAETALEMVA